tara:strand:+ start:129 stop:335 length:207 start_codon:yes stop_codon:yes gene_type:complete
MDSLRLAGEIKAFCNDNFESGYDVPAMCWEDIEYLDWIEEFNVTGIDSFIDSYSFMIEHRKEIQSTAF